jgi:hypothetical protein
VVNLREAAVKEPKGARESRSVASLGNNSSGRIRMEFIVIS